MNKDELFLLNDLGENGMQCSWDWPADLRFAQHLGDTEAVEFFQLAIQSRTVLPVLLARVKLHGRKVNQRRLRALRSLIHKGKVEARWSGMGENGVSYFGVNRTRSYRLKRGGA